MPIIKCPAIEKPMKQFFCEVLRTASSMHYQEYTGEWKPVQPERWENWTVLAETKEGAKKIAEYHFYQSHSDNIKISETVSSTYR
jgi:hypothetical protein